MVRALGKYFWLEIFIKITLTIKRHKIIEVTNVKKLFGYTIVLDGPKVDPLTYVNSIINLNKIDNVQPLQSAAVILNEKQTAIALEVFFESMKYLKSWSQTDNITILYVFNGYLDNINMNDVDKDDYERYKT